MKKEKTMYGIVVLALIMTATIGITKDIKHETTIIQTKVSEIQMPDLPIITITPNIAKTKVDQCTIKDKLRGQALRDFNKYNNEMFEMNCDQATIW